MCLKNELIPSTLPDVFQGYCVVMATNKEDVFRPADLCPSMWSRLKQLHCEIGKECEAEFNSLGYGGFHGAKDLEALISAYNIFFDPIWVKAVFEREFCGELPEFKVCLAEFRTPLAEGISYNQLPAFRAKYRKLIKVVYEKRMPRRKEVQ